jgi:hypothetical protein
MNKYPPPMTKAIRKMAPVTPSGRCQKLLGLSGCISAGIARSVFKRNKLAKEVGKKSPKRSAKALVEQKKHDERHGDYPKPVHYDPQHFEN